MADCRKCRYNYKPSTCEPKCNRMCDGESDFEPITNAMRIRSMSDEELAEFIEKVSGTCLVDALGGKSECNTECRVCKIKFGSILDWLQSESE